MLQSLMASWSTRFRRPPAVQLGRKHAQRGMALMEALIAILVFTFGILGLIGLEASAINSAVDSDDRNRAALFASEIASTMWLNGTVVVSGTQLTTWQTNVANAAGTGMANGTLAIAQVGTTNAADITITWKAPSRAANAAVSQLTTRVILP